MKILLLSEDLLHTLTMMTSFVIMISRLMRMKATITIAAATTTACS